jgi:hypothetical protein
MADGRCTTMFESGRLFNDGIYTQAGIQMTDNLAYRRYLQNSAPEDIVPSATCSLYSYVKDFDIIESTNVISQLAPKDD